MPVFLACRGEVHQDYYVAGDCHKPLTNANFYDSRLLHTSLSKTRFSKRQTETSEDTPCNTLTVVFALPADPVDPFTEAEASGKETTKFEKQEQQ